MNRYSIPCALLLLCVTACDTDHTHDIPLHEHAGVNEHSHEVREHGHEIVDRFLHGE